VQDVYAVPWKLFWYVVTLTFVHIVMWQLHPDPHPIPLKWPAYINLAIWGHVLDVIVHAKFQLDRFGFSDPQVTENRYLSLTGGIALTTLTCYTVITIVSYQ